MAARWPGAYYHFFLHPDSYPGPPAAEAAGPFDILLNGCHLRDHAANLPSGGAACPTTPIGPHHPQRRSPQMVPARSRRCDAQLIFIVLSPKQAKSFCINFLSVFVETFC